VRAVRLLAVVSALALTPGVAQAAQPDATATYTGPAGDGGWYVGPVTVHWSVSGDVTSSSGCEAAILLSADTTGRTLSCTVSGPDGTVTRTTKVIRIDQTAPAVSAAAAARAPDHDGWYTAPVAVAWSGTDATSGIAACTALTYSGPDAAPASVEGTCRDQAGNTSAPSGLSFEYDATPPTLAGLRATAGDTSASLAWTPSPDVRSVTVTRSPGVGGSPASMVYQGAGSTFRDGGLRNGVRYAYTVTAVDAAGNATSASTSADPSSWLVGPPPGARLSTPPVLRWHRVARARYYNVQVFLGRHKVLSAWPSRTVLHLRRTWRYRGRRERLAAGHYRWYVWPGYGPRRDRKYGRLLGRRDFSIVA
jgi:hypothetical protein